MARLQAIAPQAQPCASLDRATLNHIHLRVDDLDAAQEFYERHFGWEPVQEIPADKRKMRFLLDKRGFLLVLETHPDHSAMPSWFHLGFQLTSRSEVKDAASYFEAHGISLLSPLADSSDFASFTISDPSGYHLQIYWDAGTSA